MDSHILELGQQKTTTRLKSDRVTERKRRRLRLSLSLDTRNFCVKRYSLRTEEDQEWMKLDIVLSIKPFILYL